MYSAAKLHRARRRTGGACNQLFWLYAKEAKKGRATE